MNIFYTSNNVNECARFLDDKRVNKMIIETAQLLCNAYRHFYGEIEGLYRSTHINHPCSKWTRENHKNYIWLLIYLEALLQEYTNRFGKIHATSRILTLLLNNSICDEMTFQTEPPNIVDQDLRQIDTKEAYKIYLQRKWNNDKRKPKWSYK